MKRPLSKIILYIIIVFVIVYAIVFLIPMPRDKFMTPADQQARRSLFRH